MQRAPNNLCSASAEDALPLALKSAQLADLPCSGRSACCLLNSALFLGILKLSQDLEPE